MDHVSASILKLYSELLFSRHKTRWEKLCFGKLEKNIWKCVIDLKHTFQQQFMPKLN